jgi:hypothetical protein
MSYGTEETTRHPTTPVFFSFLSDEKNAIPLSTPMMLHSGMNGKNTAAFATSDSWAAGFFVLHAV